jgi:hypothetical protein
LSLDEARRPVKIETWMNPGTELTEKRYGKTRTWEGSRRGGNSVLISTDSRGGDAAEENGGRLKAGEAERRENDQTDGQRKGATCGARGGDCLRRGRRRELGVAAADDAGTRENGTGDGDPERSRCRGHRTPGDVGSGRAPTGASRAESADATECFASVGTVGRRRRRRRCNETLQK